MRREPGQLFLERAERAIRVLYDSDPEIPNAKIEEQRESGVFICEALTDPSELDHEFPPTIPGSLYHFFATTTRQDAHAVLVLGGMDDDEEEGIFIAQAYREAALGMMDNLVYR